MLWNKEKRKNQRNYKIFEQISIPAHGRILDVSHGDGSLLKKIKFHYPDTSLFGVDLQLPAEKQDDIDFQIASADQLPFPTQKFDIVICSMSLHHYDKPRQTISELARVLKPGGTLYLTDIFPSNKFGQWFYNLIKCHEPYHFEKFYRAEELTLLTDQVKLKRNHSYNISLFPRINNISFTQC